MDFGTVTVVTLMTLLFFGAIAWMAVHSRRHKPADEASKISEIGAKGK